MSASIHAVVRGFAKYWVVWMGWGEGMTKLYPNVCVPVGGGGG